MGILTKLKKFFMGDDSVKDSKKHEILEIKEVKIISEKTKSEIDNLNKKEYSDIPCQESKTEEKSDTSPRTNVKSTSSQQTKTASKKPKRKRYYKKPIKKEKKEE